MDVYRCPNNSIYAVNFRPPDIGEIHRKDEGVVGMLETVGWTDKDAEILSDIPWDRIGAQVECLIDSLRPSASSNRPVSTDLQKMARRYFHQLRLRPGGRDGDEDGRDSLSRVSELDSAMGREGVRWIILKSIVDGLLEDEGGVSNTLRLRLDTLFKRVAHDLRVDEVDQLTRHAFYDTVTTLPNRLATQKYLENLLHDRRPFVVFYFDLDGFKMVNDSFGHLAGDRVLRTVAERWKNLLRRTDWLGRWGGDEFLMVVPDSLSPDAVWRFAVRIRQTCEDAITLPRVGTVNVSASCGYACFPDEGGSLDELLDRADRRLYRAKKLGGVSMLDASDLGDWSPTIERAVEEDRIEVHYQPIVHTGGTAAEQWEALVRFRDPEGQIHLPTEFLASLSPDTVVVLDCAVIRQVFRDLAHWKRVGRKVRVSINIDPWDLLSAGWTDQLATLHEEFADVSPEDITFELRESLTPLGIRRVVESLVRLTHAGYQVALDDFGSGAVSLNRLQELPISAIKIDPSLVKQWDAEAGRVMIQSIIGLSRPMGFRVVAEGIETVSQRDALAAWGCDAGQGWFYGAAMPAAEVLTWSGVSFRSSTRTESAARRAAVGED